MKNKALSIRIERFCELVVSGENQTDAWINAGHKVSRAAARAAASRALTRGNVKTRIAELRAPQTAAALLTKDEKRRYLAELLRTPIGQITPDSVLCTEFVTIQVAGGNRGKLRRGNASSGNETEGVPVIQTRVKMADKLRAIELDSKLAGHFEPDRIEVEAGSKTLDVIAARAKKVGSILCKSPSQR